MHILELIIAELLKHAILKNEVELTASGALNVNTGIHAGRSLKDKYIIRSGPFSETFIGLDFSQRIILIAVSGYAGEIKKATFSVFTYLIPHKNVLQMHW